MKPPILKLITWFCASLFCMQAAAQVNRIQLKTYFNTSFEDIHESQLSTWTIGFPSLAVNQQVKEKWYHELELSTFQIRREEWRSIVRLALGDVRAQETDVSVRYEFGRTWITGERWLLQTGLAAQPRFLRERLIGSEEIQDTHEYQLRFGLVPRVAYRISDQLSLEAGAVVNIYDTYTTNRESDFAIPSDTRWPKAPLTLRLGIAYRLSQCD